MRINMDQYTEEYVNVLREIKLAAERAVHHNNIQVQYAKGMEVYVAMQTETEFYVKHAHGDARGITLRMGSSYLYGKTLRELMALEFAYGKTVLKFYSVDADTYTEHFYGDPTASTYAQMEVRFKPEKEIDDE